MSVCLSLCLCLSVCLSPLFLSPCPCRRTSGPLSAGWMTNSERRHVLLMLLKTLVFVTILTTNSERRRVLLMLLKTLVFVTILTTNRERRRVLLMLLKTILIVTVLGSVFSCALGSIEPGLVLDLVLPQRIRERGIKGGQKENDLLRTIWMSAAWVVRGREMRDEEFFSVSVFCLRLRVSVCLCIGLSVCFAFFR